MDGRNEVYGFMHKWKHIDLGQVFTPIHIAKFAAKLIDVNKDDVVLDATAGTGALLFAAMDYGCEHVLGCEFDPEVYSKLENNLSQTGITFDTMNADASSDEVSKWIKEHNPTKVILNPPYEKKYNTFEILINVLDALNPGTQVALFYPCSHLDKPTKKWKQHFSENHRIEKIIKLPENLFSPFVSVSTSLFIITAGIPQSGQHIWGCSIEDDGLTRKKGKYREDTKGVWEHEKEPYWYNVIKTGIGDDTVEDIDPKEGLSYKTRVDITPTEEDFKKTVSDYLDFKVKSILRNGPRWDEAQQRLAALAYVVGSENVLDCVSHPDRYFKEV